MANNHTHQVGQNPPNFQPRVRTSTGLNDDSYLSFHQLQSVIDDLRADSDICKAKGHIIDLSDGERPVEYLDGAVVGYCQECKCRVFYQKIKGGLVAAWVNALSAQLLNGDFDAELMADFSGAVALLEGDLEAVQGALHTAALVKEVVAHRLRND